MTRKYQVWIRDTHLAGHILCGDDETATIDDAMDYARRVWDKDVIRDDVSICEIPSTYYQEIYESTAEDSIALGM